MDTVLSVIIPTYNCETYLDECLGSVLGQLPADYELIVVDDGSTDGTVSKLASYNGKYNNIHIVCCEHRGASGARNTGLCVFAQSGLSGSVYLVRIPAYRAADTFV